MGIPVVSSPQAARGVQASAGEHLLVGRDDSDFALQVIKLLREPGLGRQMAASARQQLRAGHSWPCSMQLLDALLTRKNSKLPDGEREVEAAIPL